MLSRFLGCAIGVFVLAGCSTGPGEQTDATVDVGDVAISERQREILARAETTGFVSFEDYQSVMLDMRQCAVDAGVGVSEPEFVDIHGVPTIRFWFTAPTGGSIEKWDAVETSCATYHSSAVDDLYWVTSGVQQLQDDEMAQLYREYGGAVATCLAEHGVAEVDAADPDHWIDASLELLEGSGIDCLEIVGWWDAATFDY